MPHHRTTGSLILSLVLTLTGASTLTAGDAATKGPDFTQEVRPILARYCLKCHGPDDKARKAGLRLDVREQAMKLAKSGSPVLAPGKPDESELVYRIFSKVPREMMPPPSTKMALSEEQKDTLKRWIAAGAEYRQHWSLVQPTQVPLPPVKLRDGPANPIDRFILAHLEARGLTPSPRADRYALIRRLSLDLIGLPPTPQEVDAFVNDTSPNAYEKLVDRLLASPHYGERWARRWLDLARYADTNGYKKDRPRSIWPYRDWVINALNADMPFDQFTIEQLAGDLLPNATLEQRIATGFHRNTMINEEGGIDPLEFRFHAMTDRLATTGTVWLGLTVGCAQCHTHKFDPIPQREYYQLLAFLNNADEPELDLPRPDITARRQHLEKQIAERIAALPGKFPVEEKPKPDDKRPLEVRRRQHLEGKFNAWVEQQKGHLVRWQILRPDTAKANLPLLTLLDDHSVLASGDQSKRDTYEMTFRGNWRGVTAIRLEALPDERLPKHGPGRVYYEGPHGDFHLSEITLTAAGKPVKLAKASHSFARKGFTAETALDGNPQTGWGINGGQGKRHVAVFNLAAPLGEVQELHLTLLFERYYAAGLGRFRVSLTTDAKSAVAHDLPLAIEELLLTPTEKWTAEQRQEVLQEYLLNAPELATARAEIDQLRKQMPEYPNTLVLQERPPENPRRTYIHHRGEFLQPTDEVEPGVLSVLPPLPRGVPRNRLGFARWLVSPENPLTARVTMNRQWAAFFGRGLVRTTEDFGLQGEVPTHPELLDWLAVEFIKQGWSLKKMHRLIVTSATYQQSSRVTPELLEKDPQNRFLGHGPRVRLEAELIRDAVLRAGGVSVYKIGGPSVFPPQPPNVTTEGTYGKLAWKPSEGEDRYRRGLYTFSKRTAPFAMSAIFDGPSGEACVARRDVSNTPLQALTMLNDVAIHEAAQALGKTLAARSASVEERIGHAFRVCLVRPPRPEEVEMLARYFQAQKKRFISKELDAQAVAGKGSGDVNERAAWTVLVRVLFNLDEFITKN